jgi:Fe-S cluster biogenesis protein NfuA
MDETMSSPREESERIQALLDEVRELAPRPAWQRVEELVQRLVSLYGEGLRRLLDHARAVGADGPLTGRLCDDELVSSLLLLHDLHPLSVDERVGGALDRVRPYLAERGARIELIEVRDAVARIRFIGGGGCSSGALREAVRRAVEDAAPELEHVEVEEPPAAPLVQLRRPGAAP